MLSVQTKNWLPIGLGFWQAWKKYKGREEIQKQKRKAQAWAQKKYEQQFSAAEQTWQKQVLFFLQKQVFEGKQCKIWTEKQLVMLSKCRCGFLIYYTKVSQFINMY